MATSGDALWKAVFGALRGMCARRKRVSRVRRYRREPLEHGARGRGDEGALESDMSGKECAEARKWQTDEENA